MEDLRGTNKDIRKLLRRLHELDCNVARTRGSHWQVSRPGRPQSVTVSGTPSDRHTLGNFKADVKRHLGIAL